MRQVISFDRVKLTNNEMDDKGHVGNPPEHALLPLSLRPAVQSSFRRDIVSENAGR